MKVLHQGAFETCAAKSGLHFYMASTRGRVFASINCNDSIQDLYCNIIKDFVQIMAKIYKIRITPSKIQHAEIFLTSV